MAMLTSQTHPLRIDAVAAPTGGVIGMTFCPGKKQKHSISGHWNRDLAIDLAVIKDWGAEVVVTLMEPEELAAVGVAALGDAVEALGLEWYHLPIRDVHPPGQRFENRWVLYGLKLRRLLHRGGRCVLHCRGGLGRTGTVAARVLVELGLSPATAIEAVRAARPGTIETAAQETHVLACKPPTIDEAFLDRALGCLLGGAVGDGFGYAVEFDSLDTIRQRFGADGIREPVFNNGQLHVSDDTQMTLFTLEGLTRAATETDENRLIESLRRAYVDWLDTQGNSPKGATIHGTLAKRQAMRHARAPGNTCLSALKAGGQGTPERPINDSKGCGAVMRVAPLGWVTPGGRGVIFERAARAGALTHGHPDGWAGAGMLATLIGELFYGKGLRLALQDAKCITAGQVLRPQGLRANLLQAVQQAETSAKRLRHAPDRAITAIGQGWVGDEALAIALYAVLTSDSFEEAIRRAANHSGDSDSTASIAGQIWGAWKGIDSLPMAWVRRLDVLPECLHGVSELAKQGHAAAMTSAMRRNKLLEPRVKTGIDTLPAALSRDPEIPPPSPVVEEQSDPPSDSVAIDYDEIDLKQVSLYEQAQRVQALIAFYHQWEAALMPFTATVWDSLTEPKAPKVAFMAKAVGLKGSDKLALRKVLDTYLKETDAMMAAIDDFETEYDILEQKDEYWEAACRYFQHLDEIIEGNAQRWGRLLNGEPMDPPPEETVHLAEVIRGPWLRLD